MRRITRGTSVGFIAGLAVAIACTAKMSSAPGGRDGVPDAAADTTGAPDRVRTADTDADQLAEGENLVSGSTVGGIRGYAPVLAGPLVITDIWTPLDSFSNNGVVNAITFGTSFDQNCNVIQGETENRRSIQSPMHGIRIVVRAGHVLCGFPSSSPIPLQWSGYRPYPAN